MSEVAGDDTVSESSIPPSPATSPEILEHEIDETEGPSTSSRPPRQRTLPARFCQDSSESDNDGAVCMLCDSNEPESLSAKTIFWIDCDKWGCWAHTFCAFGSNAVTCRFLCSQCSI